MKKTKKSKETLKKINKFFVSVFSLTIKIINIIELVNKLKNKNIAN